MKELNSQKKKVLGLILLFASAVIFGSCYVASSIGMESTDAFTFNSFRFPLGAIFLLPIIITRDIARSHSSIISSQIQNHFSIDKKTWIHGFWLGSILCLAAYLQQAAFKYTTSGKIAFITSLYILFVPLIGIFLRKKVPLLTWVGIIIGTIGLWFLSISSSNFAAINLGDLLALACAICYAFHFILIDQFVNKSDPIKLSFVQFFIAGILSILFMFFCESPSIPNIYKAMWALIYSGIMSCGIGFTLQIIGQKHANPVLASLIICLESVFGVIFATLFLNEHPSSRELIGCTLMLIAVFIAQLSDLSKN